jgi:hypothetical protein
MEVIIISSNFLEFEFKFIIQKQQFENRYAFKYC